MSTSTSGINSSTTYIREQAEKEAAKSGKVSHTDFLKLLTKQLTTQDPLNPMQDLDFTAQLAQLQALDEQMAMTKSMQAMRIDTQLQAGTAMIGKYISGTDEVGATATGMVSRVVQSNGTVQLELANKQRVDVGSVNNVWNDAASMYDEMSNSGSLIGMWVEAGLDSAGQPIRGIIEKVQITNGQVQFKLYGGQTVSWSQIKEMRAPTDDEIYYTLPDSVRQNIEKAQSLRLAYLKGKDAKGNDLEGIATGAELDPNTHKVYVVLSDGNKIDVTTLEGDPRLPSTGEATSLLNGKWAIGMDNEGNELSGLIIGAEERDDGLVLKLSNGQEVYYDTISTIRKPTDKELAENTGSGDDSGGASETEETTEP